MAFMHCIITFCVFIALTVGQIPYAEQEALIDFYNGLTPASQGKLVGFKINTTNPCTWTGIACTGSTGDILRSVSSIKYSSSNSLEGTISPSISKLTSMIEFNIDSNLFYGTVPPSIYNMSSLRTLRLANNQLEGTLPYSLERMTSLQRVYFNRNKFTGSLPEKVAGIASRLVYFTAANNDLTGTIPAEYGSLTQLTIFYINSNHLTGTIPPSLGNLAFVTEFKIGSNELTGPIPSELSGLSACTLFHIYSNQLSGTIPESLGRLPRVLEFYVYINRLEGSIPDGLTSASTMTKLRADSNLLTGTIPASIGSLTSLTELMLNKNRLTGTIPTTIGFLTSLSTLDLTDNALRGYLPLSFVSMTSLSTAKLTKNQFRGSIPQGFATLALSELSLDENQLQGDFPEFWQTRPSMTVNIGKNCFNLATIPTWLNVTYTTDTRCSLNVCGDGICSAIENCTSCSSDCPSPCDSPVEQDECQLTPNGGCDPLTKCIDTPYSFECSSCPSGYTGNGLSGCIDIDECRNATTNNCDKEFQDCINTPGSFNCSNCRIGTQLIGGVCVDLDECAINNGGCSQFRTCYNWINNGSYCGDCPSNRKNIGNTSCSDIIDGVGNNLIEFQEYNQSLYGAIGAIVAIGVCVAMFAVAMLALFWTNFAKHGSFYCAVIVVGAFLSYVAAISVLPEHTDELCLVFPWFLGTAFSLVYGCLFLKTWTLYRVWMNASNFKRTTYTPFYILKLLAINLTIEVAYLIAWTIVDPPKVTMVKMVDSTYAPLCESEHTAWWAVFLGVKGLWLCFGAVLSVLTKDVAKEYNESSSIAYATYNNLVLCIIGVPLATALRKVPGGVEIIMVSITCIAFTFTICILFFDIWYQALFPDRSIVKTGSMKSSSTYSAEMRSSNVSAVQKSKSSGSGSADSHV